MEGTGGAATAGPSGWRSLPRPAPAASGSGGVLAEAFDLVKSLRNDASPYALRPADPEAFGALVVAFAVAVARSGADSTNQHDTRYYDGYWKRFCDKQNTSRLCSDVTANTCAGPQG